MATSPRMSWNTSNDSLIVQPTHSAVPVVSHIPKTSSSTQRVTEVTVNASGEKIITQTDYTVYLYDFTGTLRTYTNLKQLDYMV